jgi:hypothetical protein
LAAGQIALDEDLLEIEKASSQKPIVRVVQSVVQSLAHNTATAITFSSETIDTDGFFNAGTSPTRVTPKRAGYYRVQGAVIFASNIAFTNMSAWIRKNGGTNLPPAGRVGGLAAQGAPASAPTAQAYAAATSCIVDLDGVDDYVELVGQHANTGSVSSNTNVSSQYCSTLELEFIRSL